ncbi:MAG: DnaJ domain-containing protein [Rhizobiales bacterium]|nr:DnaJ domain-containing protein [Hyphomicrobiales bacterium]
MAEKSNLAEKPSLYVELGIEQSASAAEIDKAYRQRARKAHPDTGGSSEAFHALSHAHAVLSDPERRKAYDETGYEGELISENIAARAMERIHELVASVLDSELPFEGVDLVAAIRDTLVKQKAEIASGVKKLERQAKRAEALATRFKKGSGDNFIRGLLERRAADTRQNAEKTRQEEAVFAKAIELLADYSFDHEKPAPRTAETFARRPAPPPNADRPAAGSQAK